MQSLYLPDIIHINLLCKDGKPLMQENILIGIHTFATHKNNIDISPFFSDKDGHIAITKEQLQNRARTFISFYGLMDYGSLESARPDIQIFIWGNKSIDEHVNRWKAILKNSTHLKQYEMWGDILGKRAKEAAEIEIRQREELHLFETCFNRTIKQKKDIILTRDVWDRPSKEKKYEVSFSI